MKRFWEGASLKGASCRVDLVQHATQQVPRHLWAYVPLVRVRVRVEGRRPAANGRRWNNMAGRAEAPGWRVVGWSPIGQVQAGMGLGWKGDALAAADTNVIRVCLDQWLEREAA